MASDHGQYSVTADRYLNQNAAKPLPIIPIPYPLYPISYRLLQNHIPRP